MSDRILIVERSDFGFDLTFKDDDQKIITDLATVTAWAWELIDEKDGSVLKSGAGGVPATNPLPQLVDLSSEDIDDNSEFFTLESKFTYNSIKLGVGVESRAVKPLKFRLRNSLQVG